MACVHVGVFWHRCGPVFALVTMVSPMVSADQPVVNDEVEHALSPIPVGAGAQPSSERGRPGAVTGSRVLVWSVCAMAYFIGIYQESLEAPLRSSKISRKVFLLKESSGA